MYDENSSHQHLEEQAVLYGLRQLEREEAREMAEHIVGCESCREIARAARRYYWKECLNNELDTPEEAAEQAAGRFYAQRKRKGLIKRLSWISAAAAAVIAAAGLMISYCPTRTEREAQSRLAQADIKGIHQERALLSTMPGMTDRASVKTHQHQLASGETIKSQDDGCCGTSAKIGKAVPTPIRINVYSRQSEAGMKCIELAEMLDSVIKNKQGTERATYEKLAAQALDLAMIYQTDTDGSEFYYLAAKAMEAGGDYRAWSKAWDFHADSLNKNRGKTVTIGRLRWEIASLVRRNEDLLGLQLADLLISMYPQDPSATRYGRMAWGDYYVKTRNPGEAMRLYRELLSEGTNLEYSTRVHRELWLTLINSDMFGEGRKVMEDFTDTAPNAYYRELAAFWVAYTDYISGDIFLAIKELQQLKAKATSDWVRKKAIGLLELIRKRSTKALERFLLDGRELDMGDEKNDEDVQSAGLAGEEEASATRTVTGTVSITITPSEICKGGEYSVDATCACESDTKIVTWLPPEGEPNTTSPAGTYTAQVECKDEGGNVIGRATDTLTIVEVAGVTAGESEVCVGTDVTFTVTTSPEHKESLVSWSGGGTPATGTGKTFKTQWGTSGEKTVTATCGTSSQTNSVTVVEVTSVVIIDPPPSSEEESWIALCEYATFKATTEPADHYDNVVWSASEGGEGSADSSSGTYKVKWSDEQYVGEKTVTATCGTSSAYDNVTVVTIVPRTCTTGATIGAAYLSGRGAVAGARQTAAGTIEAAEDTCWQTLDGLDGEEKALNEEKDQLVGEKLLLQKNLADIETRIGNIDAENQRLQQEKDNAGGDDNLIAEINADMAELPPMKIELESEIPSIEDRIDEIDDRLEEIASELISITTQRAQAITTKETQISTALSVYNATVGMINAQVSAAVTAAIEAGQATCEGKDAPSPGRKKESLGPGDNPHRITLTATTNPTGYESHITWSDDSTGGSFTASYSRPDGMDYVYASLGGLKAEWLIDVVGGEISGYDTKDEEPPEYVGKDETVDLSEGSLSGPTGGVHKWSGAQFGKVMTNFEGEEVFVPYHSFVLGAKSSVTALITGELDITHDMDLYGTIGSCVRINFENPGRFIADPARFDVYTMQLAAPEVVTLDEDVDDGDGPNFTTFDPTDTEGAADIDTFNNNDDIKNHTGTASATVPEDGPAGTLTVGVTGGVKLWEIIDGVPAPVAPRTVAAGTTETITFYIEGSSLSSEKGDVEITAAFHELEEKVFITVVGDIQCEQRKVLNPQPRVELRSPAAGTEISGRTIKIIADITGWLEQVPEVYVNGESVNTRQRVDVYNDGSGDSGPYFARVVEVVELPESPVGIWQVWVTAKNGMDNIGCDALEFEGIDNDGDGKADRFRVKAIPNARRPLSTASLGNSIEAHHAHYDTFRYQDQVTDAHEKTDSIEVDIKQGYFKANGDNKTREIVETVPARRTGVGSTSFETKKILAVVENAPDLDHKVPMPLGSFAAAFYSAEGTEAGAQSVPIGAYIFEQTGDTVPEPSAYVKSLSNRQAAADAADSDYGFIAATEGGGSSSVSVHFTGRGSENVSAALMRTYSDGSHPYEYVYRYPATAAGKGLLAHRGDLEDAPEGYDTIKVDRDGTLTASSPVAGNDDKSIAGMDILVAKSAVLNEDDNRLDITWQETEEISLQNTHPMVYIAEPADEVFEGPEFPETILIKGQVLFFANKPVKADIRVDGEEPTSFSLASDNPDKGPYIASFTKQVDIPEQSGRITVVARNKLDNYGFDTLKVKVKYGGRPTPQLESIELKNQKSVPDVTALLDEEADPMEFDAFDAQMFHLTGPIGGSNLGGAFAVAGSNALRGVVATSSTISIDEFSGGSQSADMISHFMTAPLWLLPPTGANLEDHQIEANLGDLAEATVAPDDVFTTNGFPVGTLLVDVTDKEPVKLIVAGDKDDPTDETTYFPRVGAPGSEGEEITVTLKTREVDWRRSQSAGRNYPPVRQTLRLSRQSDNVLSENYNLYTVDEKILADTTPFPEGKDENDYPSLILQSVVNRNEGVAAFVELANNRWGNSFESVVKVDLDADIDMDNDIDDDDDPDEDVETELGLIVGVNNGDFDEDGKVDWNNTTIEDASNYTGMREMEITIDPTSLPAGFIVSISCDQNDYVRIFDSADVVRIGPDGGANYEIPSSELSADGVIYHIEALQSKQEASVSLILKDADDNIVGDDTVKVTTIGAGVAGSYSVGSLATHDAVNLLDGSDPPKPTNEWVVSVMNASSTKPVVPLLDLSAHISSAMADELVAGDLGIYNAAGVAGLNYTAAIKANPLFTAYITVIQGLWDIAEWFYWLLGYSPAEIEAIIGPRPTVDWAFNTIRSFFSITEENEKYFWQTAEVHSAGEHIFTIRGNSTAAPILYTIKVLVVKVDLKQVSFDGTKYHTVKSDDGTTNYSAPHWQDNSSPLDGDADDTGDKKYPVCFTRNTKMKTSAKWRIEPPNLGITIKVKGDGPGNLDFPETTASISGSDMTITDVECSNSFKNEIDFFDPMPIGWKFSFDDGSTWHDAGTSKNQTYVTWDDPKQAMPIHTLVHVGCDVADGENGTVGTDDDDVLGKVWTKLQTKSVHRASDNFVLTYYGFYDANGNGSWDPGTDTDRNNPGSCTVTDAEGLISSGNGQCHSWADFMNEVMKAQGLSSINGVASKRVAVIIKAGSVAFAVQNWAKTGNSPREIVDFDAGVDGSNPTTPDPANDEAADAAGVAGQGNSPNPPSGFRNHWITKMNGVHYDPSYGLGPYTDLKAYENNAFDGSIDQVGTDYFLENLPADDGDAADHSDEVNSYTEATFP